MSVKKTPYSEYLNANYQKTLDMKRLHDGGMSYQAIAAEYDTDVKGVWRRIKKLEAGTYKMQPHATFKEKAA